MGWKIYFWIFSLSTAMIYFLGMAYSLGILIPEEGDPFFDQPWYWKDWLYVLIYGISIAGIFGFAYKKSIGKQQYWKTWFVLVLILDILSLIHDYYTGIFEQQEILYPTFTFFFFIAIFTPYYLALYFYGYKSDSLWNPQPTPPR